MSGVLRQSESDTPADRWVMPAREPPADDGSATPSLLMNCWPLTEVRRRARGDQVLQRRERLREVLPGRVVGLLAGLRLLPTTPIAPSSAG
jgi:hypothetical protein